MAALSARDAFRYGARLFGYLLVTTLLGGGLIAGGIGVLYRFAPATLSGSVPESYGLAAAGGGLIFLGLVVLSVGWLLTGFMAVTDAVRLGIDHSSIGTVPTEPSDQTSPTAPSDESPSDDGQDQSSQPDPGEERDPAGDPLAGGGSDPFDDQGDPLGGSNQNDPLAGGGADHQASGSPADRQAERGGAERRQAGPTREDDDEAWRREIEAKLDDEDGTQPREN